MAKPTIKTKKYEFVDCPDLSKMVGDLRRKKTPLDQFYFVMVQGNGGSVFATSDVDNSKIIMSTEDAQVLFNALKKYFVREIKKDINAHKLAAQLWLDFGPGVHVVAPKGQIILIDGWLRYPDLDAAMGNN